MKSPDWYTLVYNTNLLLTCLFNTHSTCVCEVKRSLFFFKVGIDISKLDGIVDDLDFTEKLISEQSVFCLPGKVDNCHIGVFPF